MSGPALLYLIIGIVVLVVSESSRWHRRFEPMCHMNDGLASFVTVMVWPFVLWCAWRQS